MSQTPGFPLLPRTRGGELEAAGIEIGDGMELLQSICERFPNRTTGGKGEQGQARYLTEVLQDAGLKPVQIDPVPCLGCDFDPAELRVPGLEGNSLEAMPVTFTGSTPAEGVTAELVYADDVEFVDFANENLRGKILLVFGLFGDYSVTKYYRAAIQTGLKGVIVIRDSDQTICYGLPPAAAGCGDLPVVSVSHGTGMEIMKSGATSAYLRVQQRIREVTGTNVVACLPANEDKLDDQLFLVSAHLDAKPVCPAAADNGAGTVMAVEVMRTLAKAKRRRDIWFAGYTDEEHGFSGSRQFPEDHPGLVEHCALQLYYDGHGTIVGRNELAVTGDEALAEFMKKVAQAISHPMQSYRQLISLDPIILFAHNVPGVQVCRRPQRTWHTEYDSIDDLAGAAMRAGVHLYAEALYRLVNMPRLPFTRSVSEEERARGLTKARAFTPRTLDEAGRGITEGKAP